MVSVQLVSFLMALVTLSVACVQQVSSLHQDLLYARSALLVSIKILLVNRTVIIAVLVNFQTLLAAPCVPPAQLDS